jgi:hypothetical protein
LSVHLPAHLPVHAKATAAVVLLCVVAGCAQGGNSESKAGPSGAGSAQASKPTAPVPPPGKEAKAIVVPLDRYGLSPAETEVIKAAEDVLTGKCMRGKGLEWKSVPRASARDAEPRNRRRYGVVEPEIAKVYGYHLPADRPSVARRSAAVKARDKALGTAEKKAAYGSGRKLGGCAKEAREELARDLPDADFGLLNRTVDATYEKSMKDRAVVRVFHTWSTCMKERGYVYPDPMKAITDKRWLKDDRVSRAETRQARTDVRCKKEADLVSVWNAAEDRIQRKAIRAEPEAFEKLERVRRQQMNTAHLVLRKS